MERHEDIIRIGRSHRLYEPPKIPQNPTPREHFIKAAHDAAVANEPWLKNFPFAIRTISKILLNHPTPPIPYEWEDLEPRLRAAKPTLRTGKAAFLSTMRILEILNQPYNPPDEDPNKPITQADAARLMDESRERLRQMINTFKIPTITHNGKRMLTYGILTNLQRGVTQA